MKKLFVICVACLLTFVFTSVTFALDEENDIAKRREKRMEKLMLSARSQGVNAEAKRANPTDLDKDIQKSKENDNSGKLLFYNKDEHYRNQGIVKFSKDMTPSEIYAYLKSVGCEARTIDYTLNIWTFAFDENEDVQKKLKEVAKNKRVEYVLPSFDTGSYQPGEGGSFNEIPGNVLTRFSDDLSMENIQAILNKVGAVIENQSKFGPIEIRFDSSKYTNQEIIDFLKGTGKVKWAESNVVFRIDGMEFIPEQTVILDRNVPIDEVDQRKTVGVEAQVLRGWDPNIDVKPIDEIVQRKAIEAQIELKGDGKNYTFSGQMANAPKEDILVQKKQ